jgi:DNA primase
MRLARETVERARAVDVVNLIGRRVRLRQVGQDQYLGLCPFHTERTPSFRVYRADGHYHCFGCGAHGSAIDFAMQTEGLSFV